MTDRQLKSIFLILKIFIASCAFAIVYLLFPILVAQGKSVIVKKHKYTLIKPFGQKIILHRYDCHHDSHFDNLK